MVGEIVARWASCAFCDFPVEKMGLLAKQRNTCPQFWSMEIKQCLTCDLE